MSLSTYTNSPSKVILCLQQKISTSWVYDQPIPSDVIANLKALTALYPVHVYCGTSHCAQPITELSNSNITIEYLVVSNIVKDMPVEHWLARHLFNKILAGADFEKHLHEVVRLGILWHYGGIYVDRLVRVSRAFSFPTFHTAWVSKRDRDDVFGILDVSYFSKQHPFISKLAELFASKYPRKGCKNCTFQFDFKELTYNMHTNSNNNRPEAIDLQFKKLSINENTLEIHHYGTLSHDTRVHDISTVNLGDEIQAFPGLQFLPFLDVFVERDNLKMSRGNDRVTCFFNAWWGSPMASWPPPSNINPIMLSIHIAEGMKTSGQKVLTT